MVLFGRPDDVRAFRLVVVEVGVPLAHAGYRVFRTDGREAPTVDADVDHPAAARQPSVRMAVEVEHSTVHAGPGVDGKMVEKDLVRAVLDRLSVAGLGRPAKAEDVVAVVVADDQVLAPLQLVEDLLHRAGIPADREVAQEYDVGAPFDDGVVCLYQRVGHVVDVVERPAAPVDDARTRVGRVAAPVQEVVVCAVEYVVHLCSEDASHDRCGCCAVEPVAETVLQSLHDKTAHRARLAACCTGARDDFGDRSFELFDRRRRGQVCLQYGELVLNGTSVPAGLREVGGLRFAFLELADNHCSLLRRQWRALRSNPCVMLTN